jgi:hypothetical protein
MSRMANKLDDESESIDGRQLDERNERDERCAPG